jgi:hypothetical protein
MLRAVSLLFALSGPTQVVPAAPPPISQEAEPPSGSALFVSGIVLTSGGALMTIPGLVAMGFAFASDYVPVTPMLIGASGALVLGGGATMLHFGVKRRHAHARWEERQNPPRPEWTPMVGRTQKRTMTFGLAVRF